MNSKMPVHFIAAMCAYTALLVALTLLRRLGPERWWLSALTLYLPQILWLLPGVALTLACLVTARHWLWVPLLCMVWVAGPIMDFCWPPRQQQQGGGAVTLRVMTWNAKYGHRGREALEALERDIRRQRPDIVLFQDAPGIMKGPLAGFFLGWQTHGSGQYAIASRFPLEEIDERSLFLPWEHHSCFRYRVRVGSTPVTLYNVHLESPRHGLNAIRFAGRRLNHLPKAIQNLEGNVHTRLMQARLLSDHILRESGPLIVAGDFNSPDGSQVCAELRQAGLHDAFAQAGRGYGYTYGHFLLRRRVPWLQASWMRIDHVMLSPHFSARRSWVGTADASDHRPVIADIVLLRQ